MTEGDAGEGLFPSPRGGGWEPPVSGAAPGRGTQSCVRRASGDKRGPVVHNACHDPVQQPA